jgi:hypothetical protein
MTGVSKTDKINKQRKVIFTLSLQKIENPSQVYRNEESGMVPSDQKRELE